MTRTTWIEAALNGPWGRERQPRIPITVDAIVADGIAAAKAGAAIIHVHAYDEASGRQRDDADLYARIVEGIRAEVDAIVYPTLPLRGSAFADGPGGAAERFAHVEALARRGLIEWSVVDPGSVNFATYRDVAEGRTGFVYANAEDDVRMGLAVCERHGLRPSYAIYEPGFTRLGAALAATYPGLPRPIYRLMLSDDFAWGFPPRPYALDAHLALLAECAPGADVMVGGLAVSLDALLPAILERDMHVRTGLEDARLGLDRSNLDLVESCVRAVRAAGHEPATAADVRRAGAGRG